MKIPFYFFALAFSCIAVICNRCNTTVTINNGNNTITLSRGELKIQGAMEMVIQQGKTLSLSMNGEAQTVDLIQNSFVVSRPSESTPLIVSLTVPDLKRIEENGACNVELDTPLNVSGDLEIELNGASKMRGKPLSISEKLEVKANGASNASLEITAQSVEIEANGASKVVISGKATNQRAVAKGASNVNLKKLQGEKITISTSGASSVQSQVQP